MPKDTVGNWIIFPWFEKIWFSNKIISSVEGGFEIGIAFFGGAIEFLLYTIMSQVPSESFWEKNKPSKVVLLLKMTIIPLKKIKK